jgi:hypothetical protein
MKKLSLFLSLLVMMMLSIKQSSAAPQSDGTITGFWISASVVNSYASAGAVSLKVYAATDNAGNGCYVMAGVDNAGNPISNQIYMVGNKGICPPQCEFSGMDSDGSAVTEPAASTNVERYMTGHAGVNNCATFTMNSLGKVRNGSTYIKVSIGSTASAAGYSDSGAPTKTSATGTASNSGM